MTRVRRVRFFKAHIPNKPGSLLSMMKRLKERGLGLCGLWGYSTSGSNAEIYVVPKNPARLRSFWASEGILEEEGVGLWLTGTDRIGALNKSLNALARAGVNIESIDAICVGGAFGSFVWIDPAMIEKATRAMNAG
jgi:prephenate dehydratase